MKKYNLIKVLFIMIILTWLLTFIIPTSTIASGITRGSITPFGIWNLLLNALVSVTYFNTLGLYIVVIAIFYGLLELIKQYNDICDKIARKFKNKRRLALIISILFFSLLSLVISDPLILLVFVPFFWKVLLKLDINKKHIVLVTIISMLVGSIGLIYNSTVANNLSSEAIVISATTKMLPTFILGILSIVAIVVFTILNTKKLDAEKVKLVKEEKEPLQNPIKVKKVPYLILTILFGSIGINKIYSREYVKAILAFVFSFTLVPAILSIAEFILQILNKADKKGHIVINNKNRNNILFIVGSVVVTLFILLATISWETLFKTTMFTDLNTWFFGLHIGNYLSTKNLIGETEVLGMWSFSGLSVLLIFISIAIKFIYSIDINKYISTVTSSIKKVLPIAITIILINVVLMVAYSSGTIVTIVDYILGMTGKSFNIITATLASIVSSTFLSDILYSSNIMGSVLNASGFTKNALEMMAMVHKAIHSIILIAAPTSAGLIIALYYFEIPYTSWIKYIWKLFVVLLLLVIAFVTILVLI